MQKIIPCIWLDGTAEEAVKLYSSIFKAKTLSTATYPAGTPGPEGSVMSVMFSLDGYQMMALNGGPEFKLNPSISMFVTCKTASESEKIWKKLSKGGKVLMEFQKYPFSEKYGWCDDRFGVSWQIFTGDSPQRIRPCLMFTGNEIKAEAAMALYTKTFKDSKIDFVAKYEEGQGTGIMHAAFTLANQGFITMDGGPMHQFTFNDALSLMIMCENQKEIDHFWNTMVASESECGWFKDIFGVSWQVVHKDFEKFLADPKKAANMFKELMTMKKPDLKRLEAAAK